MKPFLKGFTIMAIVSLYLTNDDNDAATATVLQHTLN